MQNGKMCTKSKFDIICHLTSAHPRDDIRIFQKECLSLVDAGYEVCLVVADSKGNEINRKVKIFDVGKAANRYERFLFTTIKVLQKALTIESYLYHIHDPELIPVGLILKFLGKKVVFDAHEDLPKQILAKPYFCQAFLIVLALILKLFEKIALKEFDGIISATPSIGRKFKSINRNSIVINNFPIIGDLAPSPWNGKPRNHLCYIGGIDRIRGVFELIEAMEMLPETIKLLLIGPANKELLKKLSEMRGWQERTVYLGFQSRDQIIGRVACSFAGVVNFHPVPNHTEAQPNKMFEYMSAGLPVIASNFPLWKEIVEGNHCGICINPLNPKDIANAITWLYNNPNEAETMSLNGISAVEKKFNWNNERKKLLNFYETIAQN